MVNASRNRSTIFQQHAEQIAAVVEARIARSTAAEEKVRHILSAKAESAATRYMRVAGLLKLISVLSRVCYMKEIIEQCRILKAKDIVA
jgi:hypothetical protein